MEKEFNRISESLPADFPHGTIAKGAPVQSYLPIAVYRLELTLLRYAGIVLQYLGNNEVFLAIPWLYGGPLAMQKFFRIHWVHDSTSIFERARKFASLGNSRQQYDRAPISKDQGALLNEEKANNGKRARYWKRFEPGLVVLTGAVLAPILFAQGLVTRRTVPKLPEPPGARDGTDGNGPPLTLLILGDSAAAGVGASHQDEGLLGQVVSRLSSDFRVTWALRAKTGNTTAAILRWLGTQPAQRYDVAVISLGVNDVTGLVGRDKWRRQQAELRSVLRHKFGVDTLLVSGLPPLHGFPALPQPLRWVIGARATLFNDDLRRDVAADDATTFLDMRFTADTTLMASDGFHPGPVVYAQWGERVAALIPKP